MDILMDEMVLPGSGLFYAEEDAGGGGDAGEGAAADDAGDADAEGGTQDDGQDGDAMVKSLIEEALSGQEAKMRQMFAEVIAGQRDAGQDDGGKAKGQKKDDPDDLEKPMTKREWQQFQRENEERTWQVESQSKMFETARALEAEYPEIFSKDEFKLLSGKTSKRLSPKLVDTISRLESDHAYLIEVAAREAFARSAPKPKGQRAAGAALDKGTGKSGTGKRAEDMLPSEIIGSEE